MTQEQALDILKTGANVFLTGEPGSGKTHTINQYVRYLRERGVEPAITASTGIAATHLGGLTIHSWSGIGIKKFLDKYALDRIASSEYIAKRVRRARVLIIDEVSMLGPETLVMVDAVCREVKQSQEPFGGLQIIMVGDFFQLPPVVRREAAGEIPATLLDSSESAPRFAYDSSVWTRTKPIACYLTEQHRQDDEVFLNLLTAIRSGDFGKHHFEHLEARKVEAHAAPNNVPKLYSHNVDVDRVNEEMLATLVGAPQIFAMLTRGSEALAAALKKGCLSPEQLALKVGATVMFTKNNPKAGFVNGTLGVVTELSQYGRSAKVKTRNGRVIDVEPMEWVVEENGVVKASITQLPLRLAWAMTVHKSQGMSLDEAVMDLSEVFEFGQGYVALSRVRRLSGLHLLGWNARAFQVHPEVLERDGSFRASSLEAESAFGELPVSQLEKMQSNFIIASGGRLAAIKIEEGSRRVKKEKVETAEATLHFWNEGKNLAEIAQARQLKEQTILNHLEELVLKKKINHADLNRLLTPDLIESLSTIHQVFRTLKTENLTPVFTKLHGAHSYNDLRLARLFLEKK